MNNVIIDRAINEWQNDCGAASMPKDSTQTCVVTFDTAKHFFYSDRNNVWLKDSPFLLIRQQKLWNKAQLRTATVTPFSWYFASNKTVFASDKEGGKCVCPRLSVCLSVGKVTQKRVHGNVACRQISGHGRTG